VSALAVKRRAGAPNWLGLLLGSAAIGCAATGRAIDPLESGPGLPGSGGGGAMPFTNPVFDTLPWATRDVFDALLANLDGSAPLDPAGVVALLREEKGLPEPPVRIPTGYSSQSYSCSAGRGIMPLAPYLERLCSGAETLDVHTYGASAGPDPAADSRRAGASQAELDGLRFFLGAFLHSAPQRGIQIIHLNRDPEWSAAMSGHFPFPLNARLAIPAARPLMLQINALTAEPDDPAGDEVQSITVYTRR
jgi:hypothetical protein